MVLSAAGGGSLGCIASGDGGWEGGRWVWRRTGSG